MFEVNLIAILTATIVMTAVGVIWYAPIVFGRAWLRSVGMDESSLAMNDVQAWKYTIFAVFLKFIAFYFLAHILVLAAAYPGASTILASLSVGVLVSAALGAHALWERRSLTYLLVTVGYTLVTFTGGGIIISYWPW